ncbi:MULTISPECIES: hypothetical protein [unclassified Bradyrhizobium]|uniref:hypothetical protein n=1 Tax=unclassified Bradyrhizobium TaxID=2631580 RepID=UPI0028E555A3|nr:MULTISPECIES: hypothetical protein [unclassified Bradyrhizobium]
MPDKAKEKPTAFTLLRQAIVRFLKDPMPEVLCIRGKWGVGKTYTWETLLKEVGKDAALPSYSYVSLFGIDTLDRFKLSIFENVIPMASIATGPTMETLGENLKSISTKALGVIKPGLTTIVEQAAFLSVRNYTICIDDIERKGEKLRVIDILGLVSLLKERRKCKIVLILNEDELDKTGDRPAFDKYSEKVIDTSLLFEPTSAEACQISLKGTEAADDSMRENCQKLEIANIRIIKKIERLVHEICAHLKEFDPRVTNQAVSTLVLLGWCVYAKQDALLEYTLDERYKSHYAIRDRKLTDEQKKFDDLLEAYSFGLVDAFDKVLLEAIQKGFVDTDKLTKEGKKLNENYCNEQMRKAVQGPWDAYRDSFDDNLEEICKGLAEAVKNYPDHTPVNYVDGAIMFLKQMGKADDAKQMLCDWLEAYKDAPRNLYDMESAGFTIHDPDLQKAIADRFNSFDDDRDPADVLFQIAKDHGWHEEDIVLLSKVTAEDYYAMFKRLRGLKLRSVITKALEIGRQRPGDSVYEAVGNNVLGALTKLRAESAINERRAKGIYKVP